MNRKQAKKAAPIKLAWQDQIIAAEWPEKPARATIYAVAMMLASFADRDGSGACPAVGTIASALRVKRQTVCDVLAMMVDADHLTKTGRTAYGTTIYSLRLKRHTETTLAVPHAVSPRGTQLPTLDRKGEGGGDSSPAADTPTAVVAGTNTDDIKSIESAVIIDGDRANELVADFIAAFTPAYATRSKTKGDRKLEPTYRALRTAIITKLDAGWPRDHLIERITADMPDDRKITTLNGLVTYKLSELPDTPDATAIARAVEVEAKRRIDDAERKTEQTAEERQANQDAKRRRESCLRDFRRAVRKHYPDRDADAEMRALEAYLDAEAEHESDPAGWPLSAGWVQCVRDETAALREPDYKWPDATDAETTDITDQLLTVTQGGSW